jgi:hypothetical protein
MAGGGRVMGRLGERPVPAVDTEELRKDYLRERIRAETAERSLGQIVKFLYREGAAERLCRVAREQIPTRRAQGPRLGAVGIEPLPREVRVALEEWQRRREAARMAYAAIPDARTPRPARPCKVSRPPLT